MYRDVYRELEQRRKRRLSYPWPEKIGIDEHSFRRDPVYKRTEYSTIVVDHVGDRVYELLQGKQSSELFEKRKDRPGAERVKHVTMDLSEGYRSLARALFPNATITADKFHVLRLLVPAIHRRRKRIFGSVHRSAMGRLLLRSAKSLDFGTRADIERARAHHAELAAIYRFKEKLHELYRCRGIDRATTNFDRLLRDLSDHRHIPELATLERTLRRWRTEILNYFSTGLTNARTEGFNNTAKLVKRRAYGYRNHENDRLRLLDTCFG
jgi:transposase